MTESLPSCFSELFIRDTYDDDTDARAALTHYVKTEAIRFLIRDEKAVTLPDPPSAEDVETVEEQGEFLASRTGKPIRRDIEIDWDRVIEQKSACQELYAKTLAILDYIREHVAASDTAMSVKRKAASVLLELCELFFIIGSKLNVMHVDWNDCNGQLGWQPEEPPSDAKQFTARLLQYCDIMAATGSGHEAYVAFIGVLKNTEVNLIGKLIILPVFGRTLRLFSTRRAAFLMTANTVINSTFFKKDSEILQRASDNLETLQTREKIRKTGSTPPYYLMWLGGCATYLNRYFHALGTAVYTQQTDDYHGVAPNSCASLLIKAIMILTLTFDPLQDTTTDALAWDPLGRRDALLGVDEWLAFLKPAVCTALYEFMRLYARAQEDNFLGQLQAVNLVTPLDDGSGDLEIMPVEIACLAATLCLRHEPACPVLLPRVWSQQSYTTLGICSSYVLLCCASYVALAESKEGDGSSSQLFDDTPLDLMKKERVSLYGLSLFRWACVQPFCLPSMPPETFDTVFTFALHPSKLLYAVFSSISQRPTPLNPSFQKQLLHQCIRPLLSCYRLELRLEILATLIEDITSHAACTDAMLTGAVEFFKHELLTNLATPSEVPLKPLGRVCRRLLDGSYRVTDRATALLTLLNMLKVIFLRPDAKSLQTAVLSDAYPLESSATAVTPVGDLATALDAIAAQVDIESNRGIQATQSIQAPSLAPATVCEPKTKKPRTRSGVFNLVSREV